MTTTVTTVTTVTTTTAAGLTAALGLSVAVAFIALLIAREMAAAAPGRRAVRWRRTLNIGVIPLMVSFVVIVAVRVAQSL